MDSQTLSQLKKTAKFFADNQKQAYLVGGSLRNILLGEPPGDWDIITNGDAAKLARQLADKLSGHYVRFHEKANRVIVKTSEKEFICDISSLKGSSIEEDLRQRDFTINAIAAPLDEIVRYFEMNKGAKSYMVGAPLAGALGDGLHLVDPLNGLADLKANILRAVDNDIFKHDPLRMLRAVRQAMKYQLRMDNWTEDLIRRDAALLPRVATERIHDELYTILQSNGATKQLRYLDKLGLLTVLIPEFIPARNMPQPYPHYWDVLEHSLETVDALEQLATLLVDTLEQPATLLNVGADLSRPPPIYRPSPITIPLNNTASQDLTEIRTLLLEAEQQGIFSFADLTSPRMKLAALLHDIGKPATYDIDEEGAIHFYGHPQVGASLAQHIMKRLGASTHDRRLVQLVVAHHMRPGQLAQVEPLTPRAIRRYFVDLGPQGIYVALFSLADHLATLGPQLNNFGQRQAEQPQFEGRQGIELYRKWQRHLAAVRLLLTRYIRQRESILPPRLISPEELMRRLKLEPGPQVGRLLEDIAEAQAEGRISSKEEAFWLAEEKLQHSDETD